MNRRVLFVDDEIEVLKAIERNLFDKFDVETAVGGGAGLKRLSESAPFAVVVSDMRMPEMDGAAFLTQVRKLFPDATRMLLTGHADIDATVQAVNDGNIYRFLVKPCSEETLERALEDGVVQYSLVISERELLQRTLMGAVGAIAEVLSLIEPALFSRATRLEQLLKPALDNLKYEPRWAVEMAAKLSQLGCVAVPRPIVQRANQGVANSERERAILEGHPETAHRILKSIPRLDLVSDIIRYQLSDELPQFARPEIRDGVELLRVAVKIDNLVQRGNSLRAAVDSVVKRTSCDPQIAQAFLPTAFTEVVEGEYATLSVTVAQLRVGMVLVSDVFSSTGAVVVPAGREVTAIVLERLHKFADGVGVMEPICVLPVPLTRSKSTPHG